MREGTRQEFFFWPEIDGVETEVRVDAYLYMNERDTNCETWKVDYVDFANDEKIGIHALAYGEYLMWATGHRNTGDYWWPMQDARPNDGLIGCDVRKPDYAGEK